MTDYRNLTALPRGLRNNNPLNIRKSTSVWRGLSPTQLDSAFCTFTSVEYGARAAIKLIMNYLKRPEINTLRDIINRWAPPSENNTGSYVNVVAYMSCIPADKPFKSNKTNLVALARSMAIVECGSKYAHLLSLDIFKNAYDLL